MSASIPPTDAIDELDPDLQEGLRALRDQTAARPGDVARLTDRIAAGPRHSTPRWPLAVAPALLFVAGLGMWMAGAPLGPEDVVLADGTLSLAGEPLARAMGQGSSTLEGERVLVDWVVGTIEAHEQAADRLVVATAEAEWPVGAPGALTRDRMGTHVGDAPGAACIGDRDGDTCLPVHASGWLGRAHALSDDGDPRAASLAFEAARDLAAADDAVRSEAAAGLADALVREGRLADAAAAAEWAIAEAPGTRELRLHMLAARAYLTLGDCGSALPHLHALPEPTAEETAYIAHCEEQVRR